jgi:hypothetical protein
MKSSVRGRFRLETAVASLTGFLAVLTASWRDWIEAVSGFNPDHGNGSVEWLIVAALVALCVIASAAARAERRRPRTVRTTAG